MGDGESNFNFNKQERLVRKPLTYIHTIYLDSPQLKSIFQNTVKSVFLGLYEHCVKILFIAVNNQMKLNDISQIFFHLRFISNIFKHSPFKSEAEKWDVI